MKRLLSMFLACFVSVAFVACGKKNTVKAIELMGAGDTIHDSFTFANTGVKISNEEDNVYLISGSVEKLDNEKIKSEFKIPDTVTHIVAIKLTAVGEEVDKNKVKISVNGVENFDAEHLNGSNYTFIILEAGVNKVANISVKWNEKSEEKNYIVKFSNDLILK